MVGNRTWSIKIYKCTWEYYAYTAVLKTDRVTVILLYLCSKGRIKQFFFILLFSWNFPWRGTYRTPSVENKVRVITIFWKVIKLRVIGKKLYCIVYDFSSFWPFRTVWRGLIFLVPLIILMDGGYPPSPPPMENN